MKFSNLKEMVAFLSNVETNATFTRDSSPLTCVIDGEEFFLLEIDMEEGEVGFIVFDLTEGEGHMTVSDECFDPGIEYISSGETNNGGSMTKSCKECGAVTTNNEYCDLCVGAMNINTNQGNTMKKLTQQQMDYIKTRRNELRNELIQELYGPSAVLNNELMFNDRNAGSIAFEATKCGMNVMDVLTRTEVEDLSRKDAEYEQTPHDLLDHGASDAKKYTTAQIREFMSGKETVQVSEEVEETLRVEVDKVFISMKQKELNLEYYTNKIKVARTPGQVGWIGKMMFDAIKASERTFTILEDGQEKEITVPTFFPKGTYQDFWDFYKEAKESKAARVSNTLELNYNKVLTIVNNATLSTPQDKLIEVISYEISLLDSQSLWDSLKFAKQSNKIFAYPVFKAILDNAKANKTA